MRKIAWAAVLLAAVFVFASPLRAQTAGADLTSRDWSVSAKSNFAANPPSKQAIQAFLTKLYANDSDVAYEPSAYDSFAFADLHQSGTLSLVGALAPTGPAGCGETVIVDKVGEEFESAWIDCMGSPSEISGKPVVISRDQITPYYAGASSCRTPFTVIYGWNGSAYVDMSRQFPAYYRQTLQDLQHEIASPPIDIVKHDKAQHIGADDPLSPLFCDKIEAAAIERYLGISPDAGIEDAIRWSQSSKKILRSMATGMFVSIGTPRALDNLKAMTEDSDPEVARLAEYGLTPARHPDVVHHVYTGPP